jgi:adenine-specific DNA-methyltransferase
MSNAGRPHGAGNPHPLSQLRTELIWEGKYDEYGNRRDIDVAGVSMPMQKIETIDQPRSEAAAAGQLDMFEKKTKRTDDFRNMLVWGDNKLVISSLLKNFRGLVDLIYIDPPFDVGADFTMDVPIGDERETIGKDQSTLEMVAYRDMWGKGTDSYLHMMFERLVLMKELLSDQGSIYVHCDDRVSGYIRLLLDEVFGGINFRSQITRIKCNPKNYTATSFGNIHDTIFFYAKSTSTAFNRLREERDEKQLEDDFPLVDAETGRRYTTGALHAKGIRFGATGKPWRGILPPVGRHWAYVPETLDRLDAEGLIEWSSTGNP